MGKANLRTLVKLKSLFWLWDLGFDTGRVYGKRGAAISKDCYPLFREDVLLRLGNFDRGLAKTLREHMGEIFPEE